MLIVEYRARGGENGFGASVEVDPARLMYVDGRVGLGIDGAVMQVNSREAGMGRIGLTVALAPGRGLDPGWVELARLEFRGRAGGVKLGDLPVKREVVDLSGNLR